MSSGIRRSFASLSIAALCAVFVFAGGSGRALARADCVQSDPQADVFITISSISATGLHAVITDDGPCNVPDAVVTFTFPAGTSITSATTNPTSWNCGISGIVVTCPQSGSGAPTIGVPGNHDFNLVYTLGSAAETITAQVTVGGGAAACTDGSATTTCDPDPDNNTIWALVTTAGSPASLTTCPSAPANPCTQYATLSATNGSGGVVQVQQLDSLCPAGFPNSFGKCVSISGDANAPGTITTLVLTIDASLAHGAYGGVNVINTTDGSTWSIVPNCAKNNTTYPCVFLKTKFKVGGVTLIQFVIHKITDDGWGFDG